jgi:sugar lactone lactonase YvrE
LNFPLFILEHTEIPNIPIDAKWTQNGITVAGGREEDNEFNQLSNPWGVYVDDNDTVYVADYNNNRITEWKNGATTGQIVAGGNEAEDKNDQLSGPTDVIFDKSSDSLIISDSKNKRVVRWSRRNGTSGETIISNISCRGLAMDNDGYLYVSDFDKHEVKRWKMGETKGTLVAGGNGNGDRLDQLNQPTYICVDEDHSVYVAEKLNHRVTKWVKGAEEGIVVAGGQGQGNSLQQFACPYGVIVDQLGTVYVSDLGNDRVMRWVKGAREGSIVVGGTGRGKQPNQLSQPVGLSFDGEMNLYVIDYNNLRVQKFFLDSI